MPARALGELARIASRGDTTQLGVLENQVVFSGRRAWLTTRRIDGSSELPSPAAGGLEHEVPLPREESLDVVAARR